MSFFYVGESLSREREYSVLQAGCPWATFHMLNQSGLHETTSGVLKKILELFGKASELLKKNPHEEALPWFYHNIEKLTNKKTRVDYICMTKNFSKHEDLWKELLVSGVLSSRKIHFFFFEKHVLASVFQLSFFVTVVYLRKPTIEEKISGIAKLVSLGHGHSALTTRPLGPNVSTVVLDMVVGNLVRLFPQEKKKKILQIVTFLLDEEGRFLSTLDNHDLRIEVVKLLNTKYRFLKKRPDCGKEPDELFVETNFTAVESMWYVSLFKGCALGMKKCEELLSLETLRQQHKKGRKRKRPDGLDAHAFPTHFLTMSCWTKIIVYLYGKRSLCPESIKHHKCFSVLVDHRKSIISGEEEDLFRANFSFASLVQQIYTVFPSLNVDF